MSNTNLQYIALISEKTKTGIPFFKKNKPKRSWPLSNKTIFTSLWQSWVPPKTTCQVFLACMLFTFQTQRWPAEMDGFRQDCTYIPLSEFSFKTLNKDRLVTHILKLHQLKVPHRVNTVTSCIHWTRDCTCCEWEWIPDTAVHTPPRLCKTMQVL